MSDLPLSRSWQTRGLWRWRRHAVPLLVWLLAVATAGWLFVHRSTAGELTGIALAEQRAVAPLVDGRLRLVTVELLEPVKAGQPLAVLEDDQLQAAIVTATAETARLQAELAASENRLTVEAEQDRTKQMTEGRHCIVDVERCRLRELDLKLSLETDRVQLEYLRLQLDLLTKLREQHAVSLLRFKSAETEFQTTEKRIRTREQTLAQVRQDLEQARRRQALLTDRRAETRSIDQALAPFRAAITVQERRIDELTLQRAMLVLKSPIDGVVSQSWRGGGEAVKAGDPVLTVVSARPSAVVAYMTAGQANRFAPGAPVRLMVTRDGGVHQVAHTSVQATGPLAEKLPAQLWHNPTVPEWGWPVKIAVPEELGLFSGEVIEVGQP